MDSVHRKVFKMSLSKIGLTQVPVPVPYRMQDNGQISKIRVRRCFQDVLSIGCFEPKVVFVHVPVVPSFLTLS